MSQRKANGDGSAQSVGISRRSVLGAWWKCQVQREQGAWKREPFGQFCQVLLWTLNSWKVFTSSFIREPVKNVLADFARYGGGGPPLSAPKNKLRQNSTWQNIPRIAKAFDHNLVQILLDLGMNLIFSWVSIGFINHFDFLSRSCEEMFGNFLLREIPLIGKKGQTGQTFFGWLHYLGDRFENRFC